MKSLKETGKLEHILLLADYPRLFNAAANGESIMLQSWSDESECVEVKVAASRIFGGKAEYTFVEKRAVSQRRRAIEATRAKKQ